MRAVEPLDENPLANRCCDGGETPVLPNVEGVHGLPSSGPFGLPSGLAGPPSGLAGPPSGLVGPPSGLVGPLGLAFATTLG